MNHDDTLERATDGPSPDEPPTRRAGSGDEVTVVGGGASARARRRHDDPTTGPGRGSGAGDDGPSGRGPTSNNSRDRSPVVLATIAALGLVLAAVFAGLYFTSGSGSSSAGAAGGSATNGVRAAANQFVAALLTWDSATLNQNVNQLETLSTPSYAKTVAGFYTPDNVDAAKKAQASSRGDVKSLYIQDIKGDTASVFAVIDDTLANNKSPKPVIDTVRMVMDMERDSGTWKISNVTILQAPAPGSTAVPQSGGAPSGASSGGS